MVVDSAGPVQRERLQRQRRLSAEEADARIAAQATRDQRLAVADQVLVNNGTLDDLRVAVDLLWADLMGDRPGGES